MTSKTSATTNCDFAVAVTEPTHVIVGKALALCGIPVPGGAVGGAPASRRLPAGVPGASGQDAARAGAPIVRAYSRPADLVVDPMCGTGTTLVEAALLGCRAIGVDLEERWVDLAAIPDPDQSNATLRNRGDRGAGRAMRGPRRSVAGHRRVQDGAGAVPHRPSHAPSGHICGLSRRRRRPTEAADRHRPRPCGRRAAAAPDGRQS